MGDACIKKLIYMYVYFLPDVCGSSASHNMSESMAKRRMYSDPLLFLGQASSDTDSLFQGIMFIHQIAFKIQGKINEP